MSRARSPIIAVWLTGLVALAGCDCGSRRCFDTSTLQQCVADCDDHDACTVDLCDAVGSCSHQRNCAQPACWSDACLDHPASPCASDPCVVSYAEGGFPGNSCSPRDQLACSLTQTCSSAHLCVESPRALVLASSIDAGTVSVWATRSEGDDRFITRPPSRPALTLPVPNAGSAPLWVLQFTPDGGVVQAEPGRDVPMACLYYDCERHVAGARYEVRTGGLPAIAKLRASLAGPSSTKLGFAPVRPATGTYVVRVVTIVDGPEPEALFGSNIAVAAQGCDPDIDGFRDFWPKQATQWTNGQLSLELRFVDEGILRIPVLDGGAWSSDDSVSLERFLKHMFRPGPRDLMLIIIATKQPAVPPGAALASGFAFVDMNTQNQHDALWVARHELGHLFGASDLYDRATSQCTYAPSAEIPGPNLFCELHSAELARLTAREIGWLNADGGAAATPASCFSWPGSQFPCDP